MIITTPIAAESGHWYKQDGTPCYEVPLADSSGLRPTTLRDARKLHLVPSTTTILKSIAAPSLERWKSMQLLHAALTLPRHDGEAEDDYAARVMEDSKAQGLKAREKGTEIHAAIERDLQGDYQPPNWQIRDCIFAARSALNSIGLTEPFSLEKSFASPLGYGGKIDLSGNDFIVDFKTKADWTDADVKRGLAYDENGMQLVSYARGLGREKCSLVNIYISTAMPGKYCVHEWPEAEHDRLWQMFQAVLTYWKHANKYFP